MSSQLWEMWWVILWKPLAPWQICWCPDSPPDIQWFGGQSHEIGLSFLIHLVGIPQSQAFHLPSGNLTSSLFFFTWPIEIVDLPFSKMVIFQFAQHQIFQFAFVCWSDNSVFCELEHCVFTIFTRGYPSSFSQPRHQRLERQSDGHCGHLDWRLPDLHRCLPPGSSLLKTIWEDSLGFFCQKKYPNISKHNQTPPSSHYKSTINGGS